MTDTVKTSFGAGGAGLAPTPGSATPDLATILRGLIDDIAVAQADTISTTSATAVTAGDVSATVATAMTALSAPAATATSEGAVSETKGVADGLIAGAPTTPSSQAVDPGGETDWNVNIGAGYAFVNGVGKYNAAQVDVNVSTGAKILEIGEAMYAWIVWSEVGGAVSQEMVLGTAALLGAETIPSDADITTSVGHANWTKLALCHASRTADAVVATTQDPSGMEKWGGAGTALMNDLRTKYNIAVTELADIVSRIGEAKTLSDELKNDLGEAKTLANANKVAVNLAVALANAIKVALNAIA